MDNKNYSVPVNVDAEKFVLGSVMVYAGERFASMGLTAGDFGIEKHRKILAVMRSLDERSAPIDRLTITTELSRRGELESVDGMSYLISLDDDVPPLQSIDGWINILRDYRIRRQLIESAHAIEQMAILGTETSENAIERAVSMVTDLATQTETDSFPSLAEIIQKHGGINGWLGERSAIGMLTGYKILDELTGGIMPTDLWVLAGPTGGGKSTFARNLAYQLASAGYPGAITSLEMGEEEVTDGFIALTSGLSINGLKRGVVNDRTAFRDGMAQSHSLPIYVDYRASTLPALRSGLMRLKNRFGCRWAIVDFLQQMQSVGRHGNREQEVASFAYGLKRLSIELQIGIIALSQLSRDHQKLKRKPELTDLRESGSIEFSANLVAFIYSEFQPEKMDEYPAELLLRKQRSGQGQADILYGWLKSSGKFIERGQA